MQNDLLSTMSASEFVNLLYNMPHDEGVAICEDVLTHGDFLNVVTDDIHKYLTKKERIGKLKLKRVITCRIIQTENGLKKCVYEEDMPENQSKTIVSDFCEEVLKKYASEHDGDFFAVISNRIVAFRSDEDGN